MQPHTPPPPSLTTGQFAAAIGRSIQTVRVHLWRSGEAFGIRPKKVGRLLLWPADEVNELLENCARPHKRVSPSHAAAKCDAHGKQTAA